MERKNPLIKDFWDRLKNLPTEPNFWMTEEYAKKKELQFVVEDLLAGYREKEVFDQWFYPPLIFNIGQFDLNQNIYAGFPGQLNVHLMEWEHLDNQYIYDPEKFKDLSGGKWKVFRRNVRKYPEQNPGVLLYKQLVPEEFEEEIEEMIVGWADNNIEVYDPEVVIEYLFHGQHRWGLIRNGKLVGINLADWLSETFINFRFCLDDGSPFLNEYLRLQFYLGLEEGVMVNDGGDLGKEGLKRFKTKLNPVSVTTVNSYKKRGNIPVLLG